MISIASPAAVARPRQFGAAILFFTLLLTAAALCFGGIGGVADPPAAAESSTEVASSPAADSQWLASPFAVEHTGESSPWRLAPTRLGLTFGDGTWNATTADQSAAAVLTAQRRVCAATTRRSPPLGATLQVRKVRLQI